MIIDTKDSITVGKEIGFCPDLDRGARFLVKEIEKIGDNKAVVSLKYLDGRWSPGNGESIFKLTVPEDFTQEDIESAWWEIPNITRFTM